ncbi:fumarate reductase flavoprotein subunit [Denitrobacterium detoxificans]|uniref:Fumarate reductase flavoprotein subunit n=2 Tax=Denitrobacterium detoxificans TaxID=79604 RepID=A0A1H8P9T0_9ACTN|nr:fumarate reductase flavoprotein subunit [Denitrobacterium detoxificans]
MGGFNMTTIDVSRRSFIKGGLAGAMGIVAAGSLAACAGSGSKKESSADSTKEQITVEETREADVVVVGLGASGLMAALAAADKGANVIAIDSAQNFEGTTNTHTTGAWMIGSKEQLKHADYLTEQEAFEWIEPGTHYQSNGKVLRNIIRSSAQAANYLIDGGVQLMYAFEGSTKDTPMLSRGGHIYLEEGEGRANNFRDMCAQRSNLETIFNCKAQQLVTDDSGNVTGIICKNGKTETQINAKAVIMCSGGFLANPDMIKELFAGAVLVNQGMGQNDGSGIKMCQEAGAQIGKNFSVSINEMGAANLKASPAYSWAPGRGTNPCFYLPLFGNILVDKRGERFMNEQQMCELTMFSGEPLLRDPYYYTIVDQAYVDRVKSSPVFDFLTAGTKQNMGPALLMGFQDVTLSDFDKSIDEAISQGWAAKADSIEELAKKFDLTDLPETIKAYNDACSKGYDDEFFLPADYMHAINQGPYYVFEYNPGAWVTLGGIKTDGFCRAVNADNDVIKGLYVAGVDGDFWSVPYFQGGSCNGFSLASGVLAGNTASADI